MQNNAPFHLFEYHTIVLRPLSVLPFFLLNMVKSYKFEVRNIEVSANIPQFRAKTKKNEELNVRVCVIHLKILVGHILTKFDDLTPLCCKSIKA